MKTITPTMNQSIRRTAVAVLCLLISCAAFAAGTEKFFATSAHDRVTAPFLVTLAGSEDADFDAIAGAVSRAYGVRIEPFAASGFHGFLTVTTPARARAISADARVVRVDEQRDTDSAGLPRVDSAPPPAFQAPPPAAATLQPRSEWTQSPVLWSSGSYGYDGAGNIKSIGDDQYRYDRVGRLVSATAKIVGNTSNAQTFTYDEYGNRRSATTLTASGTYVEEYPVQPLTNQLTGPCPRLTPDATCYIGQYDAAGNQTGITGGGNFTYDALGMMTTLRVDQPQGYIYDANDERIATIQYIGTSEKARRYTLRGSDNKVARELLFRAPTQQWEFGTDYLYRDGALLASYSAPDAALPDRHYHLDHLGSPRVVTDASGYRLSTTTYLPFGREAAGSDKSATRLQFTGHERDQDGSAATFGLDYMHARYYSADMGRFLSVDPTWASADLGTPQSWNRYAYVRNNPVNLTDPDGREPNVMQSGSLAAFLGAIRLIESQHPKETPGQILNRVTGYLSTHADDAGNARYLYTTEGGWIDQKHFFKAAAVALEQGEMNTNILGIGFEFVEQIGTSSFLSYEDLPSNRAGADFGDDYFYPDGSPLSSQAARYLTELGATDPQNAPNYMLLPPDQVDHGASGSGGPGQSGRDAKNGLPCTGEGGPCPP